MQEKNTLKIQNEVKVLIFFHRNFKISFAKSYQHFLTYTMIIET